MIDKVKFMETLRSVAEVAQVAEKPLTREEIISYFDDIQLTEEQLTLVFQYLQNPMLGQESTETSKDNQEQADNLNGTETTQDSEEDSFYDSESDSYLDSIDVAKNSQGDKKKGKEPSKQQMDAFQQSVENSKFLAMYLEDLACIETLTSSEAQELYIRLIDGDSSVSSRISDDWLLRVVEIAKAYSTHKVNYEDLIQEGNIGLISGINQLLGRKERIDVEEYLKECIQKAMEDYIDEINSDKDWEATIIAKTTLINEARKALAEENVAIPTNKELAEYTRIPEQEIEDILRLLKNDD